MAKSDKRLQKMKNNPRDWRIEEIQALADSLGIEWIHDGGSHVVFRSPTGSHLSIPSKRPVKPIYIKKFLELVVQVTEENYEGAGE